MATLDADQAPGYGIGAVAARTGIPEPVLRSWESRFGFPSPARLASGHRRYSDDDVERLRAVTRYREAGVSLRVAIERARASGGEGDRTLFAALRAARPELEPQIVGERTMLALSRAIEDELFARAERAVVFGSFQRVDAYRAVRARWRELAKVAETVCVFADFDRPSARRGGPVEVPIERDDALAREWSVVVDGPEFGAVLAGWERPAEGRGGRRFECLWSVDPEAVREGVGAAARLARGRGATLQLPARLDDPAPPTDPSMRALSRLAHRMVGYAASG